MHVSRAVLGGLTGVLLATSCAAAADLEGPKPYRGMRDEPYTPPVSWTGFYVGIHGGYGFSNADWDFYSASLMNPGTGSVLGGQIGYNIQSGRLVYGLEGDLSSTWMNGSDGCGGGYTCRHDVNWMGSIRGRLGFAFNDNRTLFYGTGGVAWADAKFSSRDAGGVPYGSDYAVTKQGWVAGLGVEHMLSPNLTMRLEYLNYNFNDITAPAGTLDVAATKIDLSSQVVRFGLNLKF
jgi:outer membrane immunogenic protein